MANPVSEAGRKPTAFAPRPASRRSIAALGLGFAAALFAFPASAGAVTQTFFFTGAEQIFTVPANVTSIQVTARGAPGEPGPPEAVFAAGAGGDSAVVTGTLAVAPGQTLFVEVGSPGCNGGGSGGPGDGSGDGGDGGGASDLRTISVGAGFCGVQSTASLNSRLIVAAGGGGGGAPGAGGDAGAAGASTQEAAGGGAGTATSGGNGGTNFSESPAFDGFDGVLGAGGDGGQGFPGGGGGGGGLYGGGGGGGGADVESAGGGGGSNLVPPGGSAGLTGGPAQIAITYTPGAPPAGPTLPSRGRTANAHLASGTVLIDTGDGRGYVPLTADRLIPIGSRIDACNGRIDLKTQVNGSRFQTARFWAGRFRVLQSRGNPRLNLKLIGPLDNCSRSSGAQSLALADLSASAAKVSASKKKRGRRKLVGKGRCRCRALGRRGSATTVATFWVLEDLGTRITRVQVRKGVVIFRNAYTGKRKRVRKGQTAVARPPRRR